MFTDQWYDKVLAEIGKSVIYGFLCNPTTPTSSDFLSTKSPLETAWTKDETTQP